VNIAKVMREFNKANADGQAINKKRQEYVDKAKPYSEKLAVLSRTIAQTVNPTEKEKLQKEAVAINRILEDMNQEAQRVLGEMTDHTLVEVYQSIKQVINDIAVTNNLDLVMCYPDSPNPEDDKKPVVAQMKLQSPALVPFYHRGMDITEVVVVTLNRRHPAPAVNTSSTAPMGGQIQPTGGKQ
jgi:sugar-specific transcriptional regulator TrmB